MPRHALGVLPFIEVQFKALGKLKIKSASEGHKMRDTLCCDRDKRSGVHSSRKLASNRNIANEMPRGRMLKMCSKFLNRIFVQTFLIRPEHGIPKTTYRFFSVPVDGQHMAGGEKVDSLEERFIR